MGLDPVVDWRTARDEFLALTNEKKPKEPIVKFFSSNNVKISSAIEALQQFRNLPTEQRTAAVYLKLKGSYEKAAIDYCDLLEKMIKAEAEKTREYAEWKDDKVVYEKRKTALYRGLKMLKAKLENYKALYVVMHRTYVEVEAKAKSGLPDSPSDKPNLARIDSIEKNFEVRLKVGFTRFAAAAQAIKSTPTVAVWNREFGDAGEAARSLTTALAAYKTIKTELDKGNFKMSPERQQRLDLTAHWAVELAPWGNGDKRVLAADANVLEELKTISGKVKQCSAAFSM